ncbi:MAG: DUF3179 domain-containing protein [bacterium]|nr:DUF3179 domain-containing protein [bacterium]
MNGFTLKNSSVPVEQILSGGPPRDGIPALSNPQVLSAATAPWNDEEIVIGVLRGSQARAYPLAILNWHELVNDTLGGEPILVSYCPLCGTGMVFDRRVQKQVRTFGVSGLLYQSDMLLYDRETESLWSQIESRALTGPALGRRLKLLRSVQTSWGAWKKRYPKTSVLSLQTGHARDYDRSPYGSYATSTSLIFPAPLDPRYHPKMPTLGVRLVDGLARAYPASEVSKGGGEISGNLSGREIVIRYDPDTQTFDVEAPDDVEVIEAYWFAWSAFHPNTSVFTATEATNSKP